jgi:hypothetical protein
VNPCAFEPDLNLPAVNVADDPTRFEHNPRHRKRGVETSVGRLGIPTTLNSRQPGFLTALAAERLENAPSKTEAARLAAAPLDQFAITVTPGQLEILDIDDAHGGQQQAFWNAHHDERGFASMPLSVVPQSTVSVAKVLVSVGD